jgi:hypothetical protein
MAIEVPLGKDVNLEFEILERTSLALYCHYAAENTSGVDVYLFNRLYHDLRDDGVFDIDPDLVYVDSENGTLLLSKRIPDVPENLMVEAFIVPCVTVLASGSRLTEPFSLSLPPQRMDPYDRDSHTLVENFGSVVFSLGYVRSTELGSRRVETVRSIAGPALHVDFTAEQQLLVRTAPVTLAAASAQVRKKCPRCGASSSPGSRFCSQCGAPLQAGH